MSPAAILWARTILRGTWRSTFFLTLFAGLVGASVLTAWEYSRRADTVIERQLRLHPLPDATLQSCPPGVDPSVDPTECFAPKNNLIAYMGLRQSPHVTAARVFASATTSVTGRIGGTRTTTVGTLLDAYGDLRAGYFIAGRVPDPDDPAQASASETAAAALGVHTGDEVQVDSCAPDDAGQLQCGDHTVVRITGITRSESDIVPPIVHPKGVALTLPDYGIMLSRAWYDAHAQASSGYVTTNFLLASGATLDDVRADLSVGLPNWAVLLTGYEDSPRFTALRRSTTLQAHSLGLIAIILLLAGLMFLGQAVLRQIRRDLRDRSIMTAMGATTPLSLSVIVIRLVPVVIGGVALAISGALLLSSSGPTGIAERAEVQPGFRFDPVVVLEGSALLLVMLCALVGGTSALALRTPHSMPKRVRAGAGIGGPTIRVGSRRFANGQLVAVGGTALAVAVIGVASVLGASLGRVDAAPARYGAPWDYAIATYDDPQALADGLAAAEADPYLTDLSLVSDTGPFQLPGVPAFWAVSMSTQRGTIVPVIVRGRGPAADDEVALGALTMRAMGLNLGDTLQSLPTQVSEGDDQSVPGTVGPFTVVGEALVASVNPSIGPGSGVIVTEAVRNRINTAVSPYLVVRVNPTVPKRELLDHLITTYGVSVALPGRQDDLRNLDRVASAPWVIAALVGLLAVAAVVHALATTVRRQRREFAVLRSLGFTTRQVLGALAVRSALVSSTAVVVGVPLGVVAGRWAWDLVARGVGVAAGPVVEVWAILAAVGAAIVVLLVAAMTPIMFSARMRLAEALRTE